MVTRTRHCSLLLETELVREEMRTVAMMQTPVNTSLAMPELGRELRNLPSFDDSSLLQFFLDFVNLVTVELKLEKLMKSLQHFTIIYLNDNVMKNSPNRIFSY